MVGRDPDERGRAATPLELLFDLTFVIAYGAAANELAHSLTEDHVVDGLIAFAFAVFAVTWAWINFSWFASAFDTDDWPYRITTLVQMVGVLVLALGVPDLFDSIAHDDLDARVMIVGYVVMRVPMLVQWTRAMRQEPSCAPACRAMIVTLLVAQTGWVLLLLVDDRAHLGLAASLVVVVVLIGVELTGPVLAEHRGDGTPWHPHHIAERYGLLVIITLGEGLIGTMATLSAQVGPHGPGWSMDVAVLGFAGVALTFGLWWTYFVIRWGEALAARQERSFGWGYGHLAIFGCLVATGAGLHAGAYYLEHHSTLSTEATVVTVVAPVAVYLAAMYGLYALLTRQFDPFHTLLLALSGVVLFASFLLAAAGLPLEWCLLVLSLTPWVTVVGYELVGHRHQADAVARLSES